MTMTSYTSLVQIVAGVTCVLGLAMGPRGAQAQQIEGLAPPPSNLITPSKTVPLVPGQMLAGSRYGGGASAGHRQGGVWGYAVRS